MRIMFRHPLYPFMLADVDFFVRMPDGTFAILECKTCIITPKRSGITGKSGALCLSGAALYVGGEHQSCIYCVSVGK